MLYIIYGGIKILIKNIFNYLAFSKLLYMFAMFKGIPRTNDK